MCRDQSRTPIWYGLLLVLAVFSTGARASDGLLTGSLGRWLDTEAIVELGRVLSAHPRFKGETIRVASLTSGKPLHRPSRLHQAVESHLTQQLLGTSGVTIAWRDEPICGAPTEPAYLLGVEIERDGTRSHKLNIGVIDVAESVWVSGVNFTWRGRLSATETAALNKPVNTPATGGIDSPLPVSATNQIAATMQQHLSCALPDGLDGPVYLQPGEQPALRGLEARLRSRLATTPIAALTPDPDDAAWVLKLESSAAGSGTRALALLLEDRTLDVTQQVAAVYVVGLQKPVSTAFGAALIAGAGLLTPMMLDGAEQKGICAAGDPERCVEVRFELTEPAYLFVLSTRERRLNSTSCGKKPTRAQAGERRFRMKVTAMPGDLPDAGFYAIAARNRDAAGALARHFETGPCRSSLPSHHTWLERLDTLLGKYPGAFEWRAIHVIRTSTGVQAL